MTLSPTSVTGGSTATGTVTLQCAAAPDDITVALSSTKPAVAQPDVTSLLIPAGTRTMTFTVNTNAVIETKKAAITATANGITKSSTLTVTP